MPGFANLPLDRLDKSSSTVLTLSSFQTQNMSLSQDNLHGGWASNMGGAMSASMGGGGGHFGPSGPLGPPDPQSHSEGPRRASDPVRPLDRGMGCGPDGAAAGRRLQRHHSYSTFNPRTPLPPITPRHPNQGLQLDQVAEDEPIENKLVLPDDMVNYLNQVGLHDGCLCKPLLCLTCSFIGYLDREIDRYIVEYR